MMGGLFPLQSAKRISGIGINEALFFENILRRYVKPLEMY